MKTVGIAILLKIKKKNSIKNGNSAETLHEFKLKFKYQTA